MRKFVVLNVLAILALVLVACAPQTVVVKETVVVTEKETVVVKEEVEVEVEVTKIVEVEKPVRGLGDGQTDAVDRDAGARRAFSGQRSGVDAQTAPARHRPGGSKHAHALDNTRKHGCPWPRMTRTTGSFPPNPC